MNGFQAMNLTNQDLYEKMHQQQQGTVAMANSSSDQLVPTIEMSPNGPSFSTQEPVPLPNQLQSEKIKQMTHSVGTPRTLFAPGPTVSKNPTQMVSHAPKTNFHNGQYQMASNAVPFTGQNNQQQQMLSNLVGANLTNQPTKVDHMAPVPLQVQNAHSQEFRSRNEMAPGGQNQMMANAQNNTTYTTQNQATSNHNAIAQSEQMVQGSQHSASSHPNQIMPKAQQQFTQYQIGINTETAHHLGPVVQSQTVRAGPSRLAGVPSHMTHNASMQTVPIQPNQMISNESILVNGCYQKGAQQLVPDASTGMNQCITNKLNHFAQQSVGQRNTTAENTRVQIPTAISRQQYEQNQPHQILTNNANRMVPNTPNNDLDQYRNQSHFYPTTLLQQNVPQKTVAVQRPLTDQMTLNFAEQRVTAPPYANSNSENYETHPNSQQQLAWRAQQMVPKSTNQKCSETDQYMQKKNLKSQTIDHRGINEFQFNTMNQPLANNMNSPATIRTNQMIHQDPNQAPAAQCRTMQGQIITDQILSNNSPHQTLTSQSCELASNIQHSQHRMINVESENATPPQPYKFSFGQTWPKGTGQTLAVKPVTAPNRQPLKKQSQAHTQPDGSVFVFKGNTKPNQEDLVSKTTNKTAQKSQQANPNTHRQELPGETIDGGPPQPTPTIINKSNQNQLSESKQKVDPKLSQSNPTALKESDLSKFVCKKTTPSQMATENIVQKEQTNLVGSNETNSPPFKEIDEQVPEKPVEVPYSFSEPNQMMAIGPNVPSQRLLIVPTQEQLPGTSTQYNNGLRCIGIPALIVGTSIKFSNSQFPFWASFPSEQIHFSMQNQAFNTTQIGRSSSTIIQDGHFKNFHKPLLQEKKTSSPYDNIKKGKKDLNHATIDDLLMVLHDIVLCQNIIIFRSGEMKGRFRSFEELMEITDITDDAITTLKQSFYINDNSSEDMDKLAGLFEKDCKVK